MFGLEIGTLVIILLNATGLGYYIVKTEQQTKSNTEAINELQKVTDKMFQDLVSFELDASQRFVTQENLNKIEDKITYEIRRLGDKVDNLGNHYNTKNNKDT